jgi:hypothetical protein
MYCVSIIYSASSSYGLLTTSLRWAIYMIRDINSKYVKFAYYLRTQFTVFNYLIYLIRSIMDSWYYAEWLNCSNPFETCITPDDVCERLIRLYISNTKHTNAFSVVYTLKNLNGVFSTEGRILKDLRFRGINIYICML